MSELAPPIFKFLTRNDLSLSGHQAGPVIPNTLSWYFPTLDVSKVDLYNPAQYADLRIVLFKNGKMAGTSYPRFQFQTWGGTRKPEYRITGKLAEFFHAAQPGDLLLIRKISLSDYRYRFDLISQGTLEFNSFQAMMDEIDLPPYKTKYPSGYLGEVFALETRAKAEASSPLTDVPFQLFEENSDIYVSRQTRRYRITQFRRTILSLYQARCCVTGDSMKVPSRTSYEVESAHIIPREYNGTNDARNGLCLNRRLHWAFDHGLWSVDGKMRVILGGGVDSVESNQYLIQLEGAKIQKPGNESLSPSPEALRWHRDNILL